MAAPTAESLREEFLDLVLADPDLLDLELADLVDGSWAPEDPTVPAAPRPSPPSGGPDDPAPRRGRAQRAERAGSLTTRSRVRSPPGG